MAENKLTEEQMNELGEVIERSWTKIAPDLMGGDFSQTFSHYEVAGHALDADRWRDSVDDPDKFQAEILDPFLSLGVDEGKRVLDFALKMRIYGY